MTFLRNIWYMAGWDVDFSQKPFFRKIAGEPIVLYRKEDGGIVALSDTCPHRFAPLSEGVVVGDAIQCPYHGLQFGETGACVFNPHGDGVLPKAARVKSYPVVERDTIIWVWLGDNEQADASKIEDYSVLNNQQDYTFTAGGTITMRTPYELIIDNLMDLSHAGFLHPTSLGSEALARGISSVKTVGNTVYSYRMGPNGLPSPMHVMTGACGPEDYVDFWADMRWSAPANFYLDSGVVPTGAPRDGETARILSSVQVLSPETENSTTYFIKLFRNYNREDSALTDGILAAVLAAFLKEDGWMLKHVEERMAGHEFWSLKPILLQSDAGAVVTRRALERMVREQAAEAAAA